MGSWSESCGFSGIEIGEGEAAYVMFMGKPRYDDDFGPYSHFTPTTTLIRGTYDDYGYLLVEDDEALVALFNKQCGLALKNGDQFADRDDHAVEGMQRFWVRADVFEGLGDLKQDFPYWSTRRGGYKSQKVKNIGESMRLRVQELRDGMGDAIETSKERAARITEDMDADLQAVLRAHSLEIYSLRELFGYSHQTPDYYEAFSQLLEEPGDLETLLEAYRRNYLLAYAGAELRKKLVPSERGGPQHGGEDASTKFARQIIAIQRERKKRWGDL